VIILISAFIYLKYENSCNKNSIEKMANTDDTKIRDQISSIYKADIQSIRNLADISKKLQDKGVTLPSDLTVEGKFNYLPTGSIMAFNKAVAPPGWAVCDGTKGTPDLRGRFIRMHSGTLGTKNASINVSYDKTIAGNSRSDIRSRILKHKFGEIAGTDHQALATGEMPKHNHPYIDAYWSEHWGNDKSHGNTLRGAHGAQDSDNAPYTLKRTTSNTGGNWGHNNQPPYYVLTYIMKL